MNTVELKFRARRALTGRWPIALMVELIAMLPMLAVLVAVTLVPGSSVDQLGAELYAGEPFSLPGSIWTVMLPLLAMTVVTLLSTCLRLGANHYQLGILRGEEGGISTVFSRMGSMLKVIGLLFNLWLRVMAVMLPVMLAALGLVYLLKDVALNVANVLMTILPMGVSILLVWFMLRYAMTDCILADRPETGIRQCIRESVQLMKGRKGAYIWLDLSFMGWGMLQSLAQGLLISLLGYVVGMTLGMTLSMFLQVYMQTTMCAFYLSIRAEDGANVAEQPSPDAENGGI